MFLGFCPRGRSCGRARPLRIDLKLTESPTVDLVDRLLDEGPNIFEIDVGPIPQSLVDNKPVAASTALSCHS